VSETYKVSYVVLGGDHPGAILNTKTRPEVGNQVMLGKRKYSVVEVINLIPPRGDFHYLHVTLKLEDENGKA
jgi:hypothetical protein